MVMEVLAPAGSVESLKAALLGGADAIYLGGRRFGARRYAPNFSSEELAGAVELAHSRGARAYVTVNTLIKQSELGSALSYVQELEAMGADAVIVQDRGLASAVLKHAGIPVHASTQMGLHTPEGALWAEEQGMERVILARELSMAEIARVRAASDIGLEVFIHGALCYCFSGQCLLSSFAGGRSGNRGACAQPCRKLYTLGERNGYLLSTADIFCADAIPELLGLGISAIKIEGRMRSPVYAYLAARTYKSAVARALRGEGELVTERERELLSVAFSRGFTRGYLLETEVMQRSYPDSRGLYLGEAEASDGAIRPYPERVRAGDGLTLYSGEEKAGGFEVSAAHEASRRLEAPFSLADGRYALYKTKDREFPSIEKEVAAMGFAPRTARRFQAEPARPGRERSPRSPELSAMVSSLKGLEAALPFVDRIYYDLAPRMDEAEDRCREQGVGFVPILPRVSPTIPEADSASVMVCSADQAHRFKGRRLYGHYSMNVFNSLSLEGLWQCMASVELSREELREMLEGTGSRVEVLAYGRVELMVTKDPTLAQGVLRDPKGMSFPTYRDTYGYAHILNSADLLLLEFMEELGEMGVDAVALDLRRKAPELASLVARAFREGDVRKRSAIKRRSGPVTTGHYLKGVE